MLLTILIAAALQFSGTIFDMSLVFHQIIHVLLETCARIQLGTFDYEFKT